MDIFITHFWQHFTTVLLILVSVAVSQQEYEVEMCENVERVVLRKGLLSNTLPNRTNSIISCMCRIVPVKDTRESEHGLTIIPKHVVLAKTSKPDLEGVSICPYPEEQPCTTHQGYIRHSNPDLHVTLHSSNLKFTKVDIAYYWQETEPTGSRGKVQIGFEADYDLILTCSGNISDVHITPTPRAPTLKPTETDNHGKGPKYTEKSIHTTTVTFTVVADGPSSAKKEFPVTELALAIVIPLSVVALVAIIAIVICCKRRSRRKESDQHIPTQNFYVNDIDICSEASPSNNINRFGNMAVYYNHSASSLKIQDELESNFSEENSLYGKRTPPHVDPNRYLPYNVEYTGSIGTVYEEMGSQTTFSNIESIYNEIRDVDTQKNNQQPKDLEDMYKKPNKKEKLNNEPNNEPTGFKFYDRKTINGNLFKPRLGN